MIDTSNQAMIMFSNDAEQRDQIPGLVEDDCPEDSFAPLLATQESDRNTVPLIPGPYFIKV